MRKLYYIFGDPNRTYYLTKKEAIYYAQMTANLDGMPAVVYSGNFILDKKKVVKINPQRIAPKYDPPYRIERGAQ